MRCLHAVHGDFCTWLLYMKQRQAVVVTERHNKSWQGPKGQTRNREFVFQQRRCTLWNFFFFSSSSWRANHCSSLKPDSSFHQWEICFSSLRKRIESVSIGKNTSETVLSWYQRHILVPPDSLCIISCNASSSHVGSMSLFLLLFPSPPSAILPLNSFSLNIAGTTIKAQHSLSSPAGSGPGSCLQFSPRLCLGDLHYGSSKKSNCNSTFLLFSPRFPFCLFFSSAKYNLFQSAL